ncbi:mitochondrial thioredoxin [Pichia californica]|uniref:Mitochondrial thioredoxin n=1 Tax=Pichia californica TaxID=460514 RepID=A0A9P6WIW7_9ASCO|nr:mitochondrial thioredoxin [[Candida] californica]KAG0687966.1 mitochondrial thioredoxin [[Candida] californica]
MFTARQSINAARRFAVQPASRFFHATRTAQKVTEVTTTEDFRNTVLKSPIAFVDFYATWCGPCKMIAPYVDKFSEMHKTVDFYKVDVDEASDIAVHYGISSMPTFLVIKQGKVVDKIIGANPQGINSALITATQG